MFFISLQMLNIVMSDISKWFTANKLILNLGKVNIIKLIQGAAGKPDSFQNKIIQ
jgi:hypothetical protein